MNRAYLILSKRPFISKSITIIMGTVKYFAIKISLNVICVKQFQYKIYDKGLSILKYH